LNALIRCIYDELSGKYGMYEMDLFLNSVAAQKDQKKKTEQNRERQHYGSTHTRAIKMTQGKKKES